MRVLFVLCCVAAASAAVTEPRVLLKLSPLIGGPKVLRLHSQLFVDSGAGINGWDFVPKDATAPATLARLVTRNKYLVPFRAWHVWTVESNIWKEAVNVYTNQGDRFRATRIYRTHFGNQFSYVIQHTFTYSLTTADVKAAGSRRGLTSKPLAAPLRRPPCRRETHGHRAHAGCAT